MKIEACHSNEPLLGFPSRTLKTPTVRDECIAA